MVNSSPADRLDAARHQFQSQHSSGSNPLLSSISRPLYKRSASQLSAADRLAAARDQLEASLTSLVKRNGPSPASPREKLALAQSQFAASHHAKRDLSQSAADRLAAAKDQFGVTHQHVGSKRDLVQSAADRLAAAKDQFSATHDHVGVKRDDVQGHLEYPVSTMQKTVVPLVVGLVLLLLFGLVAGFIVYKRRQKNKASENAQHHRKHLDLEDDGADEDYEMGSAARVQTVGATNVSANRAGGWGGETFEQGPVNDTPRRRSLSLTKSAQADVKQDSKEYR